MSTVNKRSGSKSDSNGHKSVRHLGMEFQCGFWGLVVLIAWAISFFWKYPELLSEGPLWTWILFIGAFFLVVVLFSAIGLHALENVEDGVRQGGLMFCSAICIPTIAAFIYLSGGANSPIVPFYVMTFTLTLSVSHRDASFSRFCQFAIILCAVFLWAGPQLTEETPDICAPVTLVNEAPNNCTPVTQMKCALDSRARVAGTYRHPIPANILRKYFYEPLYYWTIFCGTLLSIIIASLSHYFKDGEEGLFVKGVKKIARLTWKVRNALVE